MFETTNQWCIYIYSINISLKHPKDIETLVHLAAKYLKIHLVAN